MATCETCRYWSSLVAESTVGSPTLALCLAPGQAQEMRPGGHGCAAWRDAPYGSVDEPCDEPGPYPDGPQGQDRWP